MRRAGRRVPLLCVIGIVIATAPTRGQQSPVVPESILALQRWIDAVDRHQPGVADPALDAVVHLRYADRAKLEPAMTKFLNFVATRSKGQTIAARGDVEKRAAELVRRIEQSPGWPVFLQRAAVLHADAAVRTERLGGLADPTMPRVSFPAPSRSILGRRQPDAPTSPLLTNTQFVTSQDGQTVGQRPADWNWPFGRSLVDLLLFIAPADSAAAFAGAWYHATAAFMLANGLYAEATAHTDRAVAILPHDPRVLFDRGCYAELLGLPMQQILRAETRPDRKIDMPPREVTNADAESWFLRVLEVDSTLVEARVRLARLLDVSGRHAQALAEVDRALLARPTGVVAYFANLFGGRAAQALGRLDDARRFYAAALAAFPDAQSALLAGSQAALLAGDMPSARAATSRLSDRTSVIDADPWWNYHLGAGRDVDVLLVSLWAPLRR
jgi:hypothetical protein